MSSYALPRPEDDACVSRRFQFRDGFDGGAAEELSFVVTELSSFEGGHGSIVWESSVALTAFLIRHRHVLTAGGEGADGASGGASGSANGGAAPRGRRVLELGSGCGLSGLCASRLGAAVTLSDCGEVLLGNLRKNCDANGVRCEVRRLDWAGPGGDAGRFDVLLGADLVYNPRMALPLCRCIRARMAPGGVFIGVSPSARPGFLLFLHGMQQCDLHCATAVLRWRREGSGPPTHWNGKPLREGDSDDESCDSVGVAPRTPPMEDRRDAEDAAALLAEAAAALEREAAGEMLGEGAVVLPSVRAEMRRGEAGDFAEGRNEAGIASANDTLLLFVVRHRRDALLRPEDADRWVL